MSSSSTVNSQIIDSVTLGQKVVMDQSPAMSQSLLDIVLGETMGMAMHNAISSQHNMQMTASAAVTATCAKMINSSKVVPPEQSEVEKYAENPTPPLAPQDPLTIMKAAQDAAKKEANILTRANDMATEIKNVAKKALNDMGSDSSPSSAPSPDDPNENESEKDG